MDVGDSNELMTIANCFLQVSGQSCREVLRIEEGLINHSYRVTDDAGEFFLMQRVNTTVFSHPQVIQQHMQTVCDALKDHQYPYQTLRSVQNSEGNTIYTDAAGNCWRMMNWIPEALTYQSVHDASAARNAATVLAHFHKATAKIDPDALSETIPGFTALRRRRDTLEACATQIADARAEDLLGEIRKLYPVMDTFLAVYEAAPKQVIHGDPKISNFLFDKTGNPLALIDWDTIMPGPVWYDLGDMVRSFTNAGREDDAVHNDLFNTRIFDAIHTGYSSVLPALDKNILLRAGMVVTLVQGMRFLTDHLQGNIYYRVDHPVHNLIRAENQVMLARAMSRRTGD